MNKNILEFIKKFVVIILVFVLLFSSIVSQDNYHLETCHEEHCLLCAIIHVAQIIVSLSIAIILFVIVGFIIHFILSKLHENKDVFMQKSLVFQKVQLNN